MNQADRLERRAKTLKILRNFSALMSGKTLGDVFTFILFIVFSRAYGQDGVGQYSFAIAFTGIFAMFANFGLYHLAIKELSRRTDSFSSYNTQLFSLRLFLGIAALGALLLVIPFLPFPNETRLLLVILGVFQIVYRLADGIAAIFIAREDAHFAGILEAFLRIGSTLASVGVVMAGGSIILALIPLPVAVVFQLLLAYGLSSRKYGRPGIKAPGSSLVSLLRDAVPYGLSVILIQLRSRVNIVILGFFVSTNASGVYNVAFRVVFLLMFLSEFAAMAIFPQASRMYSESRAEFDDLYHKMFRLMILLGLPVAAGTWLIAPDIIQIIFGDEFAESAAILRILSALVLLTFLSRTMEMFLMSADRQMDRTKSLWISAVINVLGNLVLIPFFGIKGAAVAMVISEIVLVSLLTIQMRQVIGWPKVGSSAAISGAGVALFCVPFAFLLSLSPIIVIPASMLLYMATLVLLREIKTEEIKMMLSIARRGA